MNLATLLLAAFIVIPMAEVAAFITIGNVIGLVWTLAGIVITAVIGSFLVRQQGLQLLARIRSEVQANRLPGRELAHGVMILAAGLLLLTPGFVTDTMGFLLLVPPLRDIVYEQMKKRIDVTTVVQGEATFSAPGAPGGSRPGDGWPGGSGNRSDDFIDLDPKDYRDETPKPPGS